MSTAKLTISLTDSGLSANRSDATVYEKALDTALTGDDDSGDLAVSSVTGSDPDNTGETTTGTLTSTGGFGTKAYTLDGGATGTDAGGDYTTVTSSLGVVKLYEDGSYKYTLTAPYDTTPDSTTTEAQTEQDKDSFNYTVTDANGNTSTETLYIDIVDDVPTAYNNSNSVEEGASVSGDVLTDGTDDVFGADGPATTDPAGGVVGVVCDARIVKR